MKWFDSRRRAQKRQIEARADMLYRAVITQARHPFFYAELGVADTVDGRFDMIVLHVFLLLQRLQAEGDDGRLQAQALFDLMAADFDQNLREMGVGDHGISHRLKKMTKAFFGRVQVYGEAMTVREEGPDAAGPDAAGPDAAGPAAAQKAAQPGLGNAIARNVYRRSENQVTPQHLAWFIRYMQAAVDRLQHWSIDAPIPENGLFPQAQSDGQTGASLHDA